MNWFSSGGFTNIASTALKSAQKKIDSALDIADEKGKKKNSKPTDQKKDEGDNDFWNSWFSPSKDKAVVVAASSSQKSEVTESSTSWASESSWGFPRYDDAPSHQSETAKSAKGKAPKSTKVIENKSARSFLSEKPDVRVAENLQAPTKTASLNELNSLSLTDSSVLVGETLETEDLAMLGEGDSVQTGDDAGRASLDVSKEEMSADVTHEEVKVDPESNRSVGESHDGSFSFGIASVFSKIETGVLSLAKDLTPQKKSVVDKNIHSSENRQLEAAADDNFAESSHEKRTSERSIGDGGQGAALETAVMGDMGTCMADDVGTDTNKSVPAHSPDVCGHSSPTVIPDYANLAAAKGDKLPDVILDQMVYFAGSSGTECTADEDTMNHDVDIINITSSDINTSRDVIGDNDKCNKTEGHQHPHPDISILTTAPSSNLSLLGKGDIVSDHHPHDLENVVAIPDKSAENLRENDGVVNAESRNSSDEISMNVVIEGCKINLKDNNTQPSDHVADSPDNIVDNSCNIIDNSDNVADNPCNIADILENIADNSDNIADNSFNIVDNSYNISDSSCNISDSADVAESSDHKTTNGVVTCEIIAEACSESDTLKSDSDELLVNQRQSEKLLDSADGSGYTSLLSISSNNDSVSDTGVLTQTDSSSVTSNSFTQSQDNDADMVYLEDTMLLAQSDSSETSKLDSSCGSGETMTPAEGVGDSGEPFRFREDTTQVEVTSQNDVRDANSVNDNSADTPNEKIAPLSPSCSGALYGGDYQIDQQPCNMTQSYDDFSHISSDRFEFLKSEPSDIEIDTTTSSDIEIISAPTTNGDDCKSLDMSPLKISFPQTHKPVCHRRDDSSSSSSYSRPDQPSPERDSPERGGLLRICDDAYHPDILLKKLADVTEVLQAREAKLLELSKDNGDLYEANAILRNQLQQLETSQELEMLDVNILTKEFTQRLGESDKKVVQLNKDKEQLLKQVESITEELSARKESHQVAYQTLVEEKDEEIRELRLEGEKLSKQQLQVNTIIKKLRAKEKDTEATMASQKKKIEDLTVESTHLKNVLDSKDELEKKQTSAINELNVALSRQNGEYVVLKSELEESQEKCRSLQTALDASYKEIAELHKANAAMDSQANEAALSAETSAREELKVTLHMEQARHRQEQDNLVAQIDDMRLSMARMEKEHGRREDVLKGEITYLQQRVQEGEDRNQELTQTVTSATRPLLRQIENLQSTHAAQASSWDKLERHLTERLSDGQMQLSLAVEQERLTSENLITANSELVTLRAQVSSLRMERSDSLAKLDMYRAKLEVLEDAKNNEHAQIEVVRNSLNQEINDLKRDKLTLDNQLQLEMAKGEAERKKAAILIDQLKEKETEQTRYTPSPLSVSVHDSYHSDVATPVNSWTPDLLEHSVISSPDGSRVSVYDSVKQAGAASVIEGLTAKLKQQDGEITQLRSEISYLEMTRESMARELVNVTSRNDELLDVSSKLIQLTATIEELEHRNNALMQMYGEKVEEAEELKMDLSDVKELYRSQIDQLTKIA